jgi:heptosyltransferase-3
LDPLGIARHYETVPPIGSAEATAALDLRLPFSRKRQPYAVMRLFPRNAYKCWTKAGWVLAMRHVASRGVPIVVTGGGGQHEQDYIQAILASCDNHEIVDLSGQLSLAQVSNLLKGCSLYVGPDTGITHLAAAEGCPTVALYGPTNPRYWGPWPKGYTQDRSPFDRQGSQRRNNVFVVRRESGCSRCLIEGCHNDVTRPSRCMQELNPETVIDVIDEMLIEATRPVFHDSPAHLHSNRAMRL